MGTMPPGVPSDFYGTILEAAGGPSTKVVIDSVVGLPDSLQAVAKIGGAAVLKVNGRELLALGGGDAPKGDDSEVACDPTAVKAAAENFVKTTPGGPEALFAICWTDGPFPGGVYEVESGKVWSIKMCKLPGPVQSPVGAGDAVAGSTFHAWLEKQGPAREDPSALVDSFAFGLACGGASCLTTQNSKFEYDTVVALLVKYETKQVK